MPTKRAVCLVLGLALAGWAGRAAAQADHGLTFEAELKSAPYPQAGQPNVSVHVPPGFDTNAPLNLVVYVHGLRGCLPVLMGEGSTRCTASSDPQLGWNLGAHHDDAGTSTIFVVPHLVYGKRGGQPGAFGRAGGFRRFVTELLEGPLSAQLEHAYTFKDVATITLVAHSAGYETAIAILERGEIDALVRGVVLLDALYAFEERYARYAIAHADAGFRLISISLRGGKPDKHSKALRQLLTRALGAERVVVADADDLRAAATAHPFVFADGRALHAQVPAKHMADALAGLGLPKR